MGGKILDEPSNGHFQKIKLCQLLNDTKYNISSSDHEFHQHQDQEFCWVSLLYAFVEETVRILYFLLTLIHEDASKPSPVWAR